MIAKEEYLFVVAKTDPTAGAAHVSVAILSSDIGLSEGDIDLVEVVDFFRWYWQKCTPIPQEFYIQQGRGYVRITVLHVKTSPFLENFIAHLTCQYPTIR